MSTNHRSSKSRHTYKYSYRYTYRKTGQAFNIYVFLKLQCLFNWNLLLFSSSCSNVLFFIIGIPFIWLLTLRFFNAIDSISPLVSQIPLVSLISINSVLFRSLLRKFNFFLIALSPLVDICLFLNSVPLFPKLEIFCTFRRSKKLLKSEKCAEMLEVFLKVKNILDVLKIARGLKLG